MTCEIRIPKRSTDINKGTADVRQVREKDGVITISVNERGQGPNFSRCHVFENDEHNASEIRQEAGLHKMVDFKLSRPQATVRSERFYVNEKFQ